ncbi:MAG: DUF4142 domain-containing protein [Rhodomicrobium sp.]
MKYLLPAILAVFALAGLAGSSEARIGAKVMSPEAFAQKAMAINEFEIQAGHLALEKAQNEQIKQFAQRMIDDHTRIADEMKARLKQANLPEPTQQLDPKHEALLTKLKSLSGPAFERTYVAVNRQGHKEAVRLLETYARRGTNPVLRQIATNVLPTIKKHLKLAEALPSGRALTARK